MLRPRRDRCARPVDVPHHGHRRGGPCRALRRLRRAWRGARVDPRRRRPGRTRRRQGRGVAVAALGGARARHGPRDRPHGHCPRRALRPLRVGGPRGRRPQVGQATHGVSLQDHVARHGHPRGSTAVDLAAARHRRGSRRRRRHHRTERSLRSLHPQGQGVAVTCVGGGDLRDDARRGAGAARAAQAASWGRFGSPAQGTRQ